MKKDYINKIKKEAFGKGFTKGYFGGLLDSESGRVTSNELIENEKLLLKSLRKKYNKS